MRPVQLPLATLSSPSPPPPPPDVVDPWTSPLSYAPPTGGLQESHGSILRGCRGFESLPEDPPQRLRGVVGRQGTESYDGRGDASFGIVPDGPVDVFRRASSPRSKMQPSTEGSFRGIVRRVVEEDEDVEDRRRGDVVPSRDAEDRGERGQDGTTVRMRSAAPAEDGSEDDDEGIPGGRRRTRGADRPVPRGGEGGPREIEGLLVKNSNPTILV